MYRVLMYCICETAGFWRSSKNYDALATEGDSRCSLKTTALRRLNLKPESLHLHICEKMLSAAGTYFKRFVSRTEYVFSCIKNCVRIVYLRYTIH